MIAHSTRGIYRNEGSDIFMVHADDDYHLAATCNASHAYKACKILNDARYANDVKHQYTKAARLIAQAECLPGFAWTEAS